MNYGDGFEGENVVKIFKHVNLNLKFSFEPSFIYGNARAIDETILSCPSRVVLFSACYYINMTKHTVTSIELKPLIYTTGMTILFAYGSVERCK